MKKVILSGLLAATVISMSSSAFAAAMQLQDAVNTMTAGTASSIQGAIAKAVASNRFGSVMISDEARLAMQRELNDLVLVRLNGKTLTSLQENVVADLFSAWALLINQGTLPASHDFSGIVIQYAETESVFRGTFTSDESEKCKGAPACIGGAAKRGADRAKEFVTKC
jgi:hypothetical protein